MSQKNINFGSYPDDPGADPIRSAFEKTQQNFNELYAGVEGAQVLSVNRTAGAGITVNRPTGNVVISANISCVQVSSTTLNIRRSGQPDGTYASITSSNQILLIDLPGNIAFPDKIQNGSTNVTSYQSGTVAFSISGTSNVITFSNSTATFNNGYSITGANAVSANYFIGNGSLLTGIGSSYSNNDVANYLPTYTGNLSASDASLGNSVTANFFIGNGSLLTGLPSSYSNNDVANYLPTYNGELNPGNVNISGNLGVIGNSSFSNAITVGGTTGGSITGANLISANYFVGNGSLLTGLPSGYSNNDVANYLPTYTGNLSASDATLGNSVTANFFIGDGSLLTGLPSGYSNNDVANYLPTYTGNLTAGNAVLGNSVTANFFIGDGSLLTGLPSGYSNNDVANYLPTYNGNLSASDASLGNSVTANFFIGDGSLLTGVVTGNVSELANGTSNVVVYNSGNVSTSVNGVSNVLVVTSTGANVTGEFEITGNSIVGQGLTIGNGTGGQLTGVNFISSNNLTVSNVITMSDISNVKISGGSSAQVIATDGLTTLYWTPIPYDINFYFPNRPAANQTIFLMTATRSFSIPSSFAGSYAIAGNAANTAGGAIINITRNGTSIGTITFANNSTIGTFSGSGANFTAGQVLRFDGPAPLNNLGNIGISIMGNITL
jgi:hypothetical protein